MAKEEILLSVAGVVGEFDKSLGKNRARLEQLQVERAVVEAQIRERESRRDELSNLIAQLTGVVQADGMARVFTSAQPSPQQAGGSNGR